MTLPSQAPVLAGSGPRLAATSLVSGERLGIRAWPWRHGQTGSAALLAPFLWREPDWWRFTAPLFAIAALFGLVGLAYRAGIEWGAYAVGLAWLVTWVHALRTTA